VQLPAVVERAVPQVAQFNKAKVEHVPEVVPQYVAAQAVPTVLDVNPV